MSKQCLDIEQMKHLHELGLDTSKASMHYWIITNGEYSQEVGEYVFSEEPTCTILMLYAYESTNDAAIRQVEDIPTFTLQDILDILPREIHPKDSTFSTYYLFIDYYYKQISYSEQLGYGEYKSFSFSHNSILIDAAYEMLCLCIEKGYIPTDK